MSCFVSRPELLFDLELDRQTVAVPASLAGHVLAAHGLEAGIQVLEDAGPDVVQAGATVRGRRTLVEDPGLTVLTEPANLSDHVPVAPAGQYALLEADEVEVGVDGAERHGPQPTGRGNGHAAC